MHAGNGIAAFSLLRLGYLLANVELIEAAEKTVGYASQQILNSPMAHATLLHALEEIIEPPRTIILRGNMEEIMHWQQQCQQKYHPATCVYAIGNDENELPEAISSKFGSEEKTVAYVCTGTSCQPPIADLNELKNNLA